jgi:hypothetical protein
MPSSSHLICDSHNTPKRNVHPAEAHGHYCPPRICWDQLFPHPHKPLPHGLTIQTAKSTGTQVAQKKNQKVCKSPSVCFGSPPPTLAPPRRFSPVLLAPFPRTRSISQQARCSSSPVSRRCSSSSSFQKHTKLNRLNK